MKTQYTTIKYILIPKMDYAHNIFPVFTDMVNIILIHMWFVPQPFTNVITMLIYYNIGYSIIWSPAYLQHNKVQRLHSQGPVLTNYIMHTTTVPLSI
jgi:hypothetical protein